MPDEKMEILSVKRFGYVISAVLLLLSNISLFNKWPATPIIFLVTMYFLTGSLWIPAIIKPFYRLFGKYLIKPTDTSKPEIDKDVFSNN